MKTLIRKFDEACIWLFVQMETRLYEAQRKLEKMAEEQKR